jgi:hypothetical protein
MEAKVMGDCDDDMVDSCRQDEILDDAKNWEPSSLTGDFRKEGASSKGGFALRDKVL